MGPPIYIGGNPPSPRRSCVPAPRFNGATDLYRWKLIAAGRLSIESDPRFNGASDLYRWKLIVYIEEADPACHASMGPSIYIGGKPRRKSRAGSSRLRLQWGHRFISVETCGTFGALGSTVQASMGPPIYIGGNDQNGNISPVYDKASMGPPIYIGGNSATCSSCPGRA